MKTRLFHLHAISALHCGTGQSAGVVDLPIARARATKLPIVPGSSLRGVLRDTVTSRDGEDATALFGPRRISADADSFAGALAVGDASLLTLPVRSLAGIVCHATSPFILKRYVRDLHRAETPAPAAELPAQGEALIPAASVNDLQGKVVLEDLDLTARKNESAEQWAQCIAKVLYAGDEDSQRDFTARFAILPDDVMDFLSETATEVRARIAMNPDTGTVQEGALWYEENLPAESALWGVLAFSESRKPDDKRSEDELAKTVPNGGQILQLGGNAGVGHGLVRFLTGEMSA